jgi:hypothetical protein
MAESTMTKNDVAEREEIDETRRNTPKLMQPTAIYIGK